jgi:serine/threonine-protein kinase RsbW
VVRLSIPASFTFRDLALAAVLGAVDAVEPGFDGDARDELTTAVVEAFNNIVLHAYRDMPGGRIDMHVRAQPGSVEIHFFDHGRGFDFDSVPMPDLGELPESGMGIYIMRSFMDDVTYTCGDGGMPNVLVLSKRWELPGGGRDVDRAENAVKIDSTPPRKETSQSGWRMRSVAASTFDESAAGSLRRK